MSQSPLGFASDRTETSTDRGDEYHRLLSSERRRILLDVLAEQPMPAGLEAVAAAVAEREADADAPAEDAVERVAIALHHNHLPRMADAGVLEYEPAARSVGSFRGC